MIINMRKQNKNDFVINLEENAIDSLIHGIEHSLENSRQTDLKYSILHVSQAVELFLKARLAKEHFTLIYSKPEKSDYQSKTVDLDTLIGRLNAVKVHLEQKTLNDIKELQRYRNQIQHHRISANQESVKEIIGRGVRFLEDFLENELGLILRDEVDEITYQTLSEAIHSYEERLNQALEDLDNDLPMDLKDRATNYTVTFCLNCCEETAVYPDPKNESYNMARCYFCGEIYEAERCNRCNDIIFGEDGICYSCWTYYSEKE